MKYLKNICLIIIFSVISLCIGIVKGYLIHEDMVSKQKYNEVYLNNEKAVESEVYTSETTDDIVPVSEVEETLCVDTIYVLEEKDILKDTVVETVWELPNKYIGLNREQFLNCMETYQNSPPLSEKEKGFVSLEVKSFSRSRVVIQMNYLYSQPTDCFYLSVENNEIIVYLDDFETVYIKTGILLDSLPSDLQRKIIDVLVISSEKELFDFLETYTS